MNSVLVQALHSPLFHYLREHLVQAFLLLLLTYLLLKHVRESFFSSIPPGPIGLPIVGYRPFLGERPQMKLAELSKAYGDIISLRFGPKLAVVINDFEIMKETFSHPMALDRDREVMEHVINSGFGVLNGKEWEEQRRFSMQLARDLGLGRGQWENMIQEEVLYFVEKLKSYQGKPTDITQELNATVNNNVLSLLIGRRLEAGVEDDKIQLASDYAYVSVNFLEAHGLLSMIPALRRLLERLRVPDFYKAAKIVSDFGKMVRQEVKKRQTDEDYKSATDFINMYMKKSEALTLQNTEHNCTVTNLEGNVKVLFLGGADTIFISLNWLFRLMAKYADIQKRVHAELDEVIGREGRISYEERFKIPYTFCVLMEAQRYATTVPLPLRTAREDFVVRGYTIPKGAQILGNVYAIHHSPKHWKEPEKFNPDRFLTKDNKFATNLPGFIPFSTGRRNCPGETIAWMEILDYFTAIMQQFSITAPPGEEVKFDVMPGLVSRLKPQPLCFIERT